MFHFVIRTHNFDSLFVIVTEFSFRIQKYRSFNEIGEKGLKFKILNLTLFFITANQIPMRQDFKNKLKEHLANRAVNSDSNFI